MIVLRVLAVLLLPAMCLAQTWNPISSPIFGGKLREIIPGRHGELFGSYANYVVMSLDTGKTWMNISPVQDMTIEALNKNVRLAVLPTPGDSTVLILYPTDGTSLVVLTSLDSGATWKETTLPPQLEGARLLVNGLLHRTQAIAFAKTATVTVAFSSIDRGATWTIEGILQDLPYEITETTSGLVFLIDQDTIRKRSANGTWSTIPAPAPRVNQMASAGSRLIVQCQDSNAVYSSTDEGSHWTRMSFPVSQTVDPMDFIGYTDGSAVGIDQGADGTTSMYVSAPNSTAWTAGVANIPLDVRSAIGLRPGEVMFPDESGPMFTSTSGADWSLRATGIRFQPIWRYAERGGTIVAVTVDGNIVRGSVNGTSWEYVTPFPRLRSDFPLRGVVALDSSVFIIASSKGVLRSTDDGRTWAFVDGTSSIKASWDMVQRPSGSIALCTSQKIYESMDQGRTWNVAIDNTGKERINAMCLDATGSLLVTTDKGLNRAVGTALQPLHSTSVTAYVPVASATDERVLGVLYGSQNKNILSVDVSRDGTAYSTSPLPSNADADPQLFDAVMTPSGHLFVSGGSGSIQRDTLGRVTTTALTFNSLAFDLQLDASGALTRSGISIIERNEQPVSVSEDVVGSQVSVSPLPARESISIRGLQADASWNIRIVDLLGRTQQAMTVRPANGVVVMDAHALSPGTYSLIISSPDSGIASSRVIVIEH